MKIEFLKEYSAKTASGEIRTVAAGTVLVLSEDKANRLIAAGVAFDVESVMGIWKWFLASADNQFQAEAVTPEVWSLHKKHTQAAKACFDTGDILEAREELKMALLALRII